MSGCLFQNLEQKEFSSMPDSPKTVVKACDDLIKIGIVPGIQVSISRQGFPEVHHSAGFEKHSGENLTEITPETLMNVGSVTKPVIGLLLLKLIDQKAINIDDPVSNYLPLYPDKSGTIRQLSTHTSGYAAVQTEAWPTRETELGAFAERVYRKRERNWPAGTKMEYWSTGYFILMQLIERVAGKGIESFAREVLFEPLGLERTTFEWKNAEATGRVLPYDKTQGRVVHEVAECPPLGETGLWTNAAELVKIGRVLLEEDPNCKLISHEVARLALEDQSGGFHRSVGFWQNPMGENRCPFGMKQSSQAIGHPGYTGCVLTIDPVSNTVIAIVSPALYLQSDFCNYARTVDAVLR